MTRINRVATAVFCVVLAICLQRTTFAANKYPIPFSDHPDWQGFISNTPANASAILRAHVMTRLVIVVTLNAGQIIDNHSAANLAYQNLFSNAARLPTDPLYVVVTVYGPPNFIGVHPEYAYVFKRESEQKGWKPRPVSERELIALECAAGKTILVGHGRC